MITLGPFLLEEPVGHGGMGTVWRGRHVGTDLAVAVKVLTAQSAQDARFRAFFRNEVRVVAGLDHPRVVMVFDHGEVSEEAAERSAGEIVAGSPYLVMEWASGGTLEAAPPQAWPQAREILLDILDALAHAHAHSVIHRDLKPANVVIGTDDDTRPGLKLADFGISRPQGATAEKSLASAGAGTCSYMSPEQALGHVRDEGPWTDLYSLGCLVYKLVAGAPPFHGIRPQEIIDAHLRVAPPALAPRFPVPPGLHGWVAALLEKLPARRMRHAADAALALRRLGDSTQGHTINLPSPADEPVEMQTVPAVGASRTHTARPAEVTEATQAALGQARWSAHDRPTELVSFLAPAVPDSWQAGVEGNRSALLIDAGLGLYGLRAIPLVDRDAERDRLWSALRSIAGDGETRAVVLAGPAGCGKSRLAEWLCAHAAELGAAVSLRAFHHDSGGPETGVGPALRRHLHCEGLGRGAVLERVEREFRMRGILDLAEWLAMTELVTPTSEEDRQEAADVIRFDSPTERHELVRRYLSCLADERPVILWLDDVQWGEDALAFAVRLLERHGDHAGRTLVILTATEEALAERPAAAKLLRRVLDAPRCERVEVPPLPKEQWRPLVRGLLGLEGKLAATVEERAAGNPLFAVQLVGDWVQRGILEPGPRGFRLRAGATAEMPDDLREIWETRVRQLLRGRRATEGIALEVAAVLGQTVSAGEWSDACNRAGVVPAWSLVEQLLDRRLARAERSGPRSGWSFVHAMVRESLIGRAREAGRLEGHHRATAQMLSQRSGPGIAERLGRHLLAAKLRDEAMEPLLRGAQERLDTGDLRLAANLLAERESALRVLGATEDDARWADGWVLTSRLENQRGNEEAYEWARRAEKAARAHGWSRTLANALATLTAPLVLRGELDDAAAAARESLELFRELGDRGGEAWALYWSGVAAIDRGDLSSAGEFQEQALRHFEELEDGAGLSMALYELGRVHRRLGDLDRSREFCERNSDVCKLVGRRTMLANVILMLGELARVQERYEEAERHYRQALAIYEAIGSGNAEIARLNLGLALLGRGHYAQAKGLFEEAIVELERGGWKALVACAHVELLACCVPEDDTKGWDRHIEAARTLILQSGFVDPDLGWAAGLAGDLARAQGWDERARDAYELALVQWRALERDEEIRRIEELLT